MRSLWYYNIIVGYLCYSSGAGLTDNPYLVLRYSTTQKAYDILYYYIFYYLGIGYYFVVCVIYCGGSELL